MTSERSLLRTFWSGPGKKSEHEPIVLPQTFLMQCDELECNKNGSIHAMNDGGLTPGLCLPQGILPGEVQVCRAGSESWCQIYM